MKARAAIGWMLVCGGLLMATSCRPSGPPPTSSKFGKDLTKQQFVYTTTEVRSLLGTGIKPLTETDVKYEAHQSSRPIDWANNTEQNPCKVTIENDVSAPSPDEIDFRISPMDPSSGENWYVFRTIVGPKSGHTGGVEYAAEDDKDLELRKGEPVYAISKGYALPGGRHPIVRGRRGRAGARGTWLAVEVANEGGKDVERYYLLNEVGSKSVTVYSNSNATKAEIKAGDGSYAKIDDTGNVQVFKFNNAADDKDGNRAAFSKWARGVCACAGFEGGDK